MDCACDYDVPEFYTRHNVKAKKEHKCEECGCIIKPDNQYERATGMWEGRIVTFKTCKQCLGARNEAMSITGCGCYMHGRVWEDINDALNELTFEPGQRFYLLRLVVQKYRRQGKGT